MPPKSRTSVGSMAPALTDVTNRGETQGPAEVNTYLSVVGRVIMWVLKLIVLI